MIEGMFSDTTLTHVITFRFSYVIFLKYYGVDVSLSCPMSVSVLHSVKKKFIWCMQCNAFPSDYLFFYLLRSRFLQLWDLFSLYLTSHSLTLCWTKWWQSSMSNLNWDYCFIFPFHQNCSTNVSSCGLN
jgi:hypothetical protein